MSTIKVTNIQSPNSGTNDIIIDASGNVDIGGLSLDAGAASGSVNLDSSGRLLVGTSTLISNDSNIESYKSSGFHSVTANTGTLANDDLVRFLAVQGNLNRVAQIGVYKNAATTNPVAYLELNRESGTQGFLWVDNSGNLRTSSTITNLGTTSGTVVGTQTSDERLKNILGPVEYGLETLKQIEPVRYSLKSEPETEKLGFIAQQVQPLVPQSVFDTGEHIEGEPEDAPTKLGMEYVALTPILVNAIKELSTEIESLKARLDAAGI